MTMTSTPFVTARRVNADHNYAAAECSVGLDLAVSNDGATYAPNAKARMVCSGAIGENLDSYPPLKSDLPPEYKYHVCHFQEMLGSAFRDHKGFEALIRVQVQTVEQAKEWVKASKQSGVTWRVESTQPPKGKRVLYKAAYKCRHRIHARSLTANLRRSSKNTGCEAKMHLTLKKCQRSNGEMRRRTQDSHLPDFPLEVRIHNKHNHNLFIAEEARLRHRDVGENAIESLTKSLDHNLHAATTSALKVEQMDSNIDLHTDSHPSTDQTDATTEQRQMDRDVVEYMFNELQKLRSNEHHGPGLVAMAKQFKRLSQDPAKLLSAMHRFGEITPTTATNASKAIPHHHSHTALIRRIKITPV